MAYLEEAARSRGVVFAYVCAVEALARCGEGYLLDIRDADGQKVKLAAETVVNSAGLTREDLAPDMAGIRPKLYREGEPFRDFVIREESDWGLPGLIDLVGIEYPGLTACLAIAELVQGLVGV